MPQPRAPASGSFHTCRLSPHSGCQRFSTSTRCKSPRFTDVAIMNDTESIGLGHITVGRQSAGPIQAMACTTCAKIATFLCSPESNGRTKAIATLRSISHNSKCGTCQQLSQALKRRQRIRNKNMKVEIRLMGEEGCQYIYFTVAGALKHLPAVHASARTFPGDQNRWSLRSPTIEIAPLIRAVRQCDADHAGECHSIQDPWAKVDPIPEIILIDVEKECLSIQLGTCRYLALSYVWGVGSLNTTQTTSSNFERFQRPGAFHLDSNECQLPATVRDSMILARQFGVTYLW